MRDIDRMIDEALDDEERELLARIGGEPNIVERALGMFGAGAGWMVAVMMAVQIALFAAGVYAMVMFFGAGDPVVQLRWGLPAAVLVLMALMVKMSVAPVIYHNRVMRELKRIELQLARRARPEG